ncbi:Complement component 1 Q subcomponent-binding protein, mitochondrial [Holothuria leucospilota]|uniref:Complement component 1 Q subcomponent-binding protein, mitochondrial n=1 Tax=Holothuria leucospilota TaxID=206669 RepID=A0A9Q1CF45_HOLLE|nr:Complement component 1 Q subcomponent-binding protein, mitochondrial [Holothuria leucospilota]
MAFSSISARAGRIFAQTAAFARPLEVVKVASPILNQANRTLARSVWHLSSNKDRLGGNDVSGHSVVGNATRSVKWPSKTCTCGCAGLHTEADQQLSIFLAKEIEIEKNSQKNPKLPEIPGFSVSTDGAQVTLTKEGLKDETVKVIFNVNHSVEFEEGAAESDVDEKKDTDMPEGQMRSYPDFRVELKKTGKPTIAVQCSFTTDDDFNPEDMPEEEPDEDLFLIDEVYMYTSEASEKTYRVGSEVMQGEMYDHLLAFLESRGVDNGFVEKLADLASSYEHSFFIKFLETLQDSIKG